MSKSSKGNTSSTSKTKKKKEADVKKKSEMFWAKIFTTKQDFVVAVCDEEIIEKELEFKYHVKKEAVKIKLTKEFYGEMLVSGEIAIKLLKRATIANLMGNRTIELAEKSGFIIHENIILIDGVPHAQFVKV